MDGKGWKANMTKAGIILGLVAGVALAFALHRLSAAIRPGAFAAQQTPVPAQTPVSQRLSDEIKMVEDIRPRLVDRGAALFLLAHDYARVGEQAKALDLLKQCVALNEGFDPAGDTAFRSLKSDPEFRNLVQRARQQNPPVRRARLLSRCRKKISSPKDSPSTLRSGSSTWEASTTTRS